MKLALFPYSFASTSNLEDIARSVIAGGRLREKGRDENRYKSYLAGRCAIKFLYEGIGAPHLVSVNKFYGYLEVVNAKGKRQENLFVNVSHTEKVSVAVLSEHSVGVDIESVSRSAARVLKRVATDEEREWAEKEKGRDIHLWSAKEAAAKAYGLGMKFGLKAFEILPDKKDLLVDVKTELKTPLTVEDPGVLQEHWENFIISICSEKSSISGGIDRWVLGATEIAVLR